MADKMKDIRGRTAAQLDKMEGELHDQLFKLRFLIRSS